MSRRYQGQGNIDVLRTPCAGDAIFLDHAISRIRVDVGHGEKPSLAAETNDWALFAGSHGIVTSPIGVLQTGSNSFDPPLPEAKQGSMVSDQRAGTEITGT